MTSFRVVHAGIYSSIQDLGRYGYQRYGLSVSGATDKYSLRFGNLLLGNKSGAAGIEVTLFGLDLEVTSPVDIAVTGGDLGFKVNGDTAQTWATLSVLPGDKLRFTGGPSGCRAYLCVRGEIDVPTQFGSQSTDPLVGLGGLFGRALEAGDEIPVATPSSDFLRNPNTHQGMVRRRRLFPNLIPSYDKLQVIRVVLGPQLDAFTSSGLETFLHQSYTVTPQSNHMGCQLEGPPIVHQGSADTLSECIPEGAIQVPYSGKPIILLAGRRGVGGYTKIATVITVDIPKVAQARPGDKLVFQSVSVETAQDLLIQQERYFRLMDRRVLDM